MRDLIVRAELTVLHHVEMVCGRIACHFLGHDTVTRQTLSGKRLTICRRLCCRGRLL